MLLNLLISALVVWLAVWLLSRGESVSLRPVVFICLGMAFCSYFALRYLGAWGLIPLLVGLVFASMHWCFLSWPRALLVAFLWLGVQFTYGWLVGPIF